MSRRSSGISVLALILVVTVGIAAHSLRAHTDSAQSSKPDAPGEMTPMPLIAPFFVADLDFRSTLVLVNGSGASASADVTLRALNGTQLATQHVSLVAYGQQQMDVGTLLADKGIGAGTGSIVVTPEPEVKGPSILAALSITYLDSREGNFIDEELAMPMPSDSQVLRGVTDPSSGPPMIAVSSLADTPQHVIIQCFGSNLAGFSKIIALGAGQTVLTDACSNRPATGPDLDDIWDNDRGHHQVVKAISLTSDGMPGSFAAFGLAPHQRVDDRHFSSLTFSDPKMLVSGTTIFTGVPAGDTSALPGRTYTPQISVANFSTKPAHVIVRYAVTSADAPVVHQVWAGSLPAGTAKNIVIPNVKGDLSLQDSFILSSNAAPGDVVAKTTAETDDGIQEVEVLGKDAKVFENGGGHPWSLRGNTQSTLLLFNHSTQAQAVRVMLSANDSEAPWTKTYTLESMQTEQISISDLILNRTKDDSGKTLPANAMSGTVDWFSFNQGVKGRILQTDASTGMARNFSCGEYADVAGAEWNGGVSDVPDTATDYGIGDAEAILDLVYPGSCTGSYATTETAYDYDYTSSNSSVASVVDPTSDYAEVDANSVGTATITGTITDPSTGCSARAEESLSVKPSITSITPDLVAAATANVPITIAGAGFGSSPTVNLPLGVSEVTGSQSSSNTQITLKITVAGGATYGVNAITVSAGSQTSDPANFTIDGPIEGIVANDQLFFCGGCSTAVLRKVTMQVKNFSSSNASNILIAESASASGWNWTQSNPGVTTTKCGDNYETDSNGYMADQWTISSDTYSPVGCGFNFTTHWQWCAAGKTFLTLNGYTHTNAIDMNGVVDPPNKFSVGQVITP